MLVCAAVVLLIGRLGGAAAVAAVSTTPLSALPTQHRLAIATFHTTHSGLWIASADAPQQPVRILTVPHKVGYGLRGAVSPDGQFIAYLRLPASARDPMTQGELWRVRSDGSEPQLLFLGVDMYRAPVWSPDSETLAVRQGNREGDGITYALTAVDVATATSDRSSAASASTACTPSVGALTAPSMPQPSRRGAPTFYGLTPAAPRRHSRVRAQPRPYSTRRTASPGTSNSPPRPYSWHTPSTCPARRNPTAFAPPIWLAAAARSCSPASGRCYTPSGGPTGPCTLAQAPKTSAFRAAWALYPRSQ